MADAQDTLWTLVTLGILGGVIYLAWTNKDKLAAVLAGFKAGLGSGGDGGGTTPPAGGGGGTKTKPPAGGGIKLPPTGGGGAGVRFAAAGDWGSARKSTWKSVVATMKSLGTSVVLVPGDMSYTNVAAFKPVTDAIKQFARVIGAEGNHDSGAYASLFNGYSNSVTNIGNTSFMSLNSNSAGSAIAFAKANLSKMTGRWKVVFFHHPIKTAVASHGPTKSMFPLIPLLEAARVNLVIQAHEHNYQRFAPVKGVTYTVAGTGGEGLYKFKGTAAGTVKRTDGAFGCLFCSTSASSMSCKFVTTSGSTFDAWTIT